MTVLMSYCKASLRIYQYTSISMSLQLQHPVGLSHDGEVGRLRSGPVCFSQATGTHGVSDVYDWSNGDDQRNAGIPAG